MVARIIDVRHTSNKQNERVEVACEVTRRIGDASITSIEDLVFDWDILKSEALFKSSVTKRLNDMFPKYSPKKYIGMEIRTDDN